MGNSPPGATAVNCSYVIRVRGQPAISMSYLPQAPTACHLGPCSSADPRRTLASTPTSDAEDGHAQPDLAHIWGFRDADPKNRPG